MQSHCAEQNNNNQTKKSKKPQRGSGAQKAACAQGHSGGDEVWSWSFAFQDIQTLHTRKCKLEFKDCGITQMDLSMGFKLGLWVHAHCFCWLLSFFLSSYNWKVEDQLWGWQMLLRYHKPSCLYCHGYALVCSEHLVARFGFPCLRQVGGNQLGLKLVLMQAESL